MAGEKSLKEIKYFQHGDILFHEKDKANSLFIVQKGNIRLFSKKGSGYIDLAMVQGGSWTNVDNGLMYTDLSGDQIMLLVGIKNTEQISLV